ncbi:unnamed protein product, partial [Psylliodes chrysocephalus]
MSSAEEWFATNHLKLNEEKTQKMTFTSNKNTHKMEPIKSLGIILDANLNWGPHIDATTAKISSQIFALRQMRQSLDKTVLKMVYYALVHSHLSYGILLWGNSCKANKLFFLQKAAIRLIADVEYREPCHDLFKRYEILP